MITTGDDLKAARESLGMSTYDLGYALRLAGDHKRVGLRVREYESGRFPVSGPIAVAVEAMLAGFTPEHMEATDG